MAKSSGWARRDSSEARSEEDGEEAEGGELLMSFCFGLASWCFSISIVFSPSLDSLHSYPSAGMALASISSLPASCLTRTRVEDRAAAAALFRGGIAPGNRQSSGVDVDEEEEADLLAATAGLLSKRALGLLLLWLLILVAAAAALGRTAAGSIRERESQKEKEKVLKGKV